MKCRNLKDKGYGEVIRRVDLFFPWRFKMVFKSKQLQGRGVHCVNLHRKRADEFTRLLRSSFLCLQIDDTTLSTDQMQTMCPSRRRNVCHVSPVKNIFRAIRVVGSKFIVQYIREQRYVMSARFMMVVQCHLKKRTRYLEQCTQLLVTFISEIVSARPKWYSYNTIVRYLLFSM